MARNLSASLSILVVLLGSLGTSKCESTAITASPAVLPYDTAQQNMSSFFPSPSDQWPLTLAVPPESAPRPASGEFGGRITPASSTSTLSKKAQLASMFGVGVLLLHFVAV